MNTKPFTPVPLTLGVGFVIGLAIPTLTKGEPVTEKQNRDAIHVSPQGNDKTGRGSAKEPFATLERARDEMRRRKASKKIPRVGTTVVVHRGVYEFARPLKLTSEDSGTADAPAIFRAAPGEEVRLTGGRSIPPDSFKPVTDTKLLERLDPATRGKVLAVDLAALGIGELGQFPDRFNGAPAVPELFFNDQRMTLAHWPNKGWTTIEKIIDSGSHPRVGDKSGRPGIFEYSGDRPSRWNIEAGVWLQGYWCFDWFAETIRVKSLDRQKRQITLAEPHLYSLRQGNPSPRRYRALNLLEELDRPGEFYIDRDSGRLYFWPPDEIAGARIVLSTLNAPIISVKDASHVALRGFVVEAGQGNGIEVNGGSDVRVQACTVRNLLQLGIQVSGGAGHKVEACDIHDTGTGGLVLSGGDRRALTPAGHEAINNHIWQFSRHKLTYANAIMLQGVGNRAAHNLIHDAPHQAIGVGGNDHVFEFNRVHHICTETDDCGAFYKGRNPSCRGNIVRYNFWYDIGSPMGHGNAAVYFDDGDGGDTVFGNVFYRCGEPGRGSFGTVFSHGGHDNLAENNIFIECKRALGSAPWNDKRWKDVIDGGQGCFWTKRLLEEVDITKPPYTTRYPDLLGFMNPKPGQTRVNRAVRNVLVKCAQVSSGNWQVSGKENLITDGDPGFVDAAAGDFRLRPDSEVFKKLPGFKPIPFEKIGLYADELRPSLPREE